MRITYGSVHERIWNSLQEYQLSVIERAGVWDRAGSGDGDYGWADWLQTTVALSSAGDESVADAATSGARATYAARTARFEPSDGEPGRADGPRHRPRRPCMAALSIAVSDGLELRAFLTGEGGHTADLEVARTRDPRRLVRHARRRVRLETAGTAGRRTERGSRTEDRTRGRPL